jgi:PAS domain S-box-containing protein
MLPYRSLWNRLKLTNYSLSVVLLVPFILLITGTVGAVGWISFLNGQKAVKDISGQLQEEILARITQELDSYFSVPYNINQLSTIAFIRGDLQWKTGNGTQFFLEQLRISPYIYAVYCGNKDGEFIGATRLPNEQGNLGIWVSNASTNYHQFLYRSDYFGKTNILLKDSGNYNPRERPWYKLATRMEGAAWGDCYISFSQKLPTITASQPVYDRFGQKIIGVCATDVSLSKDLNRFLAEEIKIGKTGKAFIINRKGELLSTSTNDPITVGTGKNQKLLKAAESANLLVQATALKVAEKFPDFGKIYQSEAFNFSFEHSQQWVQVLPFRTNDGLDFLIVIVVPESDFMAQIQRNTLITGISIAVALAVAVMIGIWIAQRLTHPLERLGRMSRTLAAGEWNQRVEVPSIRELKVLAESFNRMAQQLKMSFEALGQANADLEQRVDERTAALAQSEERWQLAIQGSHDGIWDFDPQHNQVFYSPRCKEMLGFADHEIPNTLESFQDLLHPEDRQRVEQAMQDHLDRKLAHFSVEFRMRNKEGQYKWILSRGQALWDDDGQAIRMAGSYSDIHDRKVAEAHLKRQAERDSLMSQISQQLLEQNLDIAIDIALESMMLFAQSQCCFLLQFNPKNNSFFVSHKQFDLNFYPVNNKYLPFQSKPICTDHFPWLYDQCHSGKGVHLTDIYQLPRTAYQEWEAFNMAQVKSLLIVPMSYQERISGGLGLVTFAEPRSWQDEEAQLLQLVGEMLAMALTRRAAEEALLQEQEKSERLLLNVLPAPIVNRLKHSLGAIADEFESVSILFADIVEFTSLASYLEPTQLVDLLNEVFSRFDSLATQLKLEKIKTIGDAYMVAAGLPTPRADHVQAIAEMALGMQSIIEDLSLNSIGSLSHPSLQIRTGINMGKVVAGVIGTHKFIYDLWGDTVNIASRMESSGEPGCIQVPESVYQCLKENYAFEERGEIQVKGKGLMKTYWLRGRLACPVNR